MPVKAKERKKGEKYRPVATVLKMKRDLPSVLEISGNKYILCSKTSKGE